MKEIRLTDVGQLKNELAKYRAGKKLDIRLFEFKRHRALVPHFADVGHDREHGKCR